MGLSSPLNPDKSFLFSFTSFTLHWIALSAFWYFKMHQFCSRFASWGMLSPKSLIYAHPLHIRPSHHLHTILSIVPHLLITSDRPQHRQFQPGLALVVFPSHLLTSAFYIITAHQTSPLSSPIPFLTSLLVWCVQVHRFPANSPFGPRVSPSPHFRHHPHSSPFLCTTTICGSVLAIPTPSPASPGRLQVPPMGAFASYSPIRPFWLQDSTFLALHSPCKFPGIEFKLSRAPGAGLGPVFEV